MARTYTEHQKIKAVEAYRTKGATEAARQTGIPKQTIHKWAVKMGVATEVVSITTKATEVQRVQAEERRARLQHLLLDKIERVMERMTEKATETRRIGGVEVEVVQGEPTPQGMQSLAITLGILIDKLRLERGEVTDRTARRDDVTVHQVPDEQLDADLARVLRAVPGSKPR